MIQEILSIAMDDDFMNSQKTPSAAVKLLEKAKFAVDRITTKTLKAQCKASFKEWLSETQRLLKWLN